MLRQRQNSDAREDLRTVKTPSNNNVVANNAKIQFNRTMTALGNSD